MSKIRAFVVKCHDDDHGASVVFAESAREARKHYDSSTCDCGYIEQLATRAPDLDQYSPGPVSIITLMAHGWNTVCQNCERAVYEDDPFVHIPKNDTFYCCQQCKDIHDEYWAKERAKRLQQVHP